MLGTIGAPTLIDLCCSEPTQELEAPCCGGMDEEMPSEDDSECCDTNITFESIDGEFHKAEVFFASSLEARELHVVDCNLDRSQIVAQPCIAPLPGTKLPSTPTNERLSVYLI